MSSFLKVDLCETLTRDMKPSGKTELIKQQRKQRLLAEVLQELEDEGHEEEEAEAELPSLAALLISEHDSKVNEEEKGQNLLPDEILPPQLTPSFDGDPDLVLFSDLQYELYHHWSNDPGEVTRLPELFKLPPIEIEDENQYKILTEVDFPLLEAGDDEVNRGDLDIAEKEVFRRESRRTSMVSQWERKVARGHLRGEGHDEVARKKYNNNLPEGETKLSIKRKKRRETLKNRKQQH